MARKHNGGTPPEPTRATRRSRRRRRRPGLVPTLVGAVLAVALVVAGVFALGGNAPADPEKATPTSAVGDRVDTDGGTLHALSLGPVVTWDPQRIASRDDVAFAGRVFARTLTAYAPNTDPDAAVPPRGRPRDHHRHPGQGPQDLVVHPARRRALAGRQPGDLRGRRLRHLAHLRHRRRQGRPDRRPGRARHPAPARRHEHLHRPLRHRRRGGRGAEGLRQGRLLLGPDHHLHAEHPAQRLQRAGQPAGVRPGQEVGRPRRRGHLRRVLRRPVHAQGRLDARQRRHLGAQPELEPVERPGAPGPPRPDPATRRAWTPRPSRSS